MGIMENSVRWLLNLLLLFSSSGTFFTSLAVAHPRRQDIKQTFSTDWLPTRRAQSPKQAQYSKQTPYDHPSLANLKQKSVKSVDVKCYPDFIEIVVNAKMFEVGVRIDGTKLRLGVEELDRCRATATSADEFTIFAGLLDCGTKHLVTEDLLIYTNYLMYSPQSTTEIIKMENAVIPIECRYGRKYSVSSDILQPTWRPYKSTVFAEETLEFDLKIMNSDWLHGGGSKVYFLGDLMSIEASVRISQHLRLRVFINNCVATLNPDKDSVPRYVFIDNGCLVDSQLPGSRSQFLPRTVDDKLQLTVDAFRFYGEDKGELFITCHLTAIPVTDTVEPQYKACSFSNERWRSADGNDLLCSQCQEQNDATHLYHSSPKTESVKTQNFGLWESEWQQVTALGPLMVLPGKWKDVPLAPRRSGRVSALVDPGARRLMMPSRQRKSRVNSKRGFLPKSWRVKYLGSLEEEEQTEGLVSGSGAEDEDYDLVEETIVMASPHPSGIKRGATFDDLEYDVTPDPVHMALTPDLEMTPATPPSNVSHTPLDLEGNHTETNTSLRRIKDTDTVHLSIRRLPIKKMT